MQIGSLNQKRLYPIIIACSLGAILEWYDFTLYAYMAPLMAILFFPQGNHVNAILLSYSVFAIGFLVRPFGAILCGHFGDRMGRRKVLLISIFVMTLSTCLIGLLPGWGKIGIAAPVILIILRILQGIAISGETSGASILVIESISSKRGLITSLVWASSGIGMLLSSLVITIMTMMFSHQQMLHWAWRIPFFIGSFTGLVGFYMRRNILESDRFDEIKNNNQIMRLPIISTFLDFKKQMLSAMSFYLLCAITIYLIFVFIPGYVAKYTSIPLDVAMAINTLTMACLVFLIPLFGYYSDQRGRRKILLASTFGFVLLSLPSYWLMVYGGVIGLIVGQLVFAVLASALNGAVTSTVLEMFPTSMRYSATAVSYNLSYSLFGGTAPFVAMYLIHSLGLSIAPSLYLIVGAGLAMFCARRINETSRAQLD